MLTYKHTYALAALLVLPLSLWFKQQYTILITPSSYLLRNSSLLSPTAYAELCATLDAHSNMYGNPQALEQLIRTACLAVIGCDIHYTAQRTASIYLHVYTPRALINGHYVICSPQAFLSPELFTSELITALPTIYITAAHPFSEASSPAFIYFIDTLPHDIFDDFVLEWHNKTYITLAHKRNAYTIISTASQHITQELLSTCAALFNELNTQTKAWLIDIRFKNAFVIKGREGDETNTTRTESLCLN